MSCALRSGPEPHAITCLSDSNLHAREKRRTYKLACVVAVVGKKLNGNKKFKRTYVFIYYFGKKNSKFSRVSNNGQRHLTHKTLCLACLDVPHVVYVVCSVYDSPTLPRLPMSLYNIYAMVLHLLYSLFVCWSRNLASVVVEVLVDYVRVHFLYYVFCS